MEATTSGNNNLKKTLIVMGIMLAVGLAVMGVFILSRGELKNIFEQNKEELTPVISASGDEIFFNFTSEEEGVNTLITNRSVIISKLDRNFTFDFPDFVDVTQIENGVIINHSSRRYSVLRMTDNNTFEWDFVFNQRPLLNRVILPLRRNINCEYQPPLNEEFNDFENCNATTCTGEIGMFNKTNNQTYSINATTYYREEKAIGSYACYGNKFNNKYKTGKLFHIYRPLVYDAENNTIWGELNITENGFLILSVDRDWLDSAVYPVTIDPQMGYITLGASTSFIGNTVIWGWANKSRSAEFDDGSDYVTDWCVGASGNVGAAAQLALYTANSTLAIDDWRPVTLDLQFADPMDITSADKQWWCYSDTYGEQMATVSLYPNNYTIVVYSSGGTTLGIAYDGVASGNEARRDTNTGFPETFVQDFQFNGRFSLYVNYTLVGAGNTCTYAGTGKWNVSCADNCVVTNIYNLGSDDLQLYGSGTFTLRNKLIVDDIIKSPTCTFIGVNNSVVKP